MNEQEVEHKAPIWLKILGYCHLTLAFALVYFFIHELISRNAEWGWWMTLYILGIAHGSLGFLHSRNPFWKCGATILFVWACGKIVYSVVFLCTSIYNKQQERDILDSNAFQGSNHDIAGSSISLATGFIGFVMFDGFCRICRCRRSASVQPDEDKEDLDVDVEADAVHGA